MNPCTRTRLKQESSYGISGSAPRLCGIWHGVDCIEYVISHHTDRTYWVGREPPRSSGFRVHEDTVTALRLAGTVEGIRGGMPEVRGTEESVVESGR